MADTARAGQRSWVGAHLSPGCLLPEPMGFIPALPDRSFHRGWALTRQNRIDQGREDLVTWSPPDHRGGEEAPGGSSRRSTAAVVQSEGNPGLDCPRLSEGGTPRGRKTARRETDRSEDAKEYHYHSKAFPWDSTPPPSSRAPCVVRAADRMAEMGLGTRFGPKPSARRSHHLVGGPRQAWVQAQHTVQYTPRRRDQPIGGRMQADHREAFSARGAPQRPPHVHAPPSPRCTPRTSPDRMPDRRARRYETATAGMRSGDRLHNGRYPDGTSIVQQGTHGVWEKPSPMANLALYA